MRAEVGPLLWIVLVITAAIVLIVLLERWDKRQEREQLIRAEKERIDQEWKELNKHP